MVTYKKYTAIDANDKGAGYGRISLGNLGYSSTQCQMVPVDLGKIAMFCPYGNIQDITYLGVNPGSMKERGVCKDTSENKECFQQVNPAFKDKLLGQMQNKNEANYDYLSEDLFTDYNGLKAAGSTCVDKSAYLYVQYSCAIPADSLQERHKDLSILACIAIFAASLYLIVLYFVKRNSKMNQLDWDIQTITPGDYTLQYEITEEGYHWFLNNVYYPGAYEERGISIGTCLKDYMKEKLERMLTDKLNEMRASGQDMSNIKIQEVKIADIVFAFNNAELIQLLKQRGNHIMFQRYDAMRAIEKRISELKDQKFRDLTRPVDAFITFEEEDGSIIGQEYEEERTYFGKKLPAKAQFLNEDFHLKESTEPTNIIWENRHWTPKDYAKRGATVVGIITILVLISFGLIFWCKSYSLQVKRKYPTVDCNVIKNTYDT